MTGVRWSILRDRLVHNRVWVGNDDSERVKVEFYNKNLVGLYFEGRVRLWLGCCCAVDGEIE